MSPSLFWSLLLLDLNLCSQAGTFKSIWDIPLILLLFCRCWFPSLALWSLSQNWCLFCGNKVVWNRAHEQWWKHSGNNASCTHKGSTQHKLTHTFKDLLSEDFVHGTVLRYSATQRSVTLQNWFKTLIPLFLHSSSFPWSAVQLFTVL